VGSAAQPPAAGCASIEVSTSVTFIIRQPHNRAAKAMAHINYTQIEIPALIRMPGYLSQSERDPCGSAVQRAAARQPKM
jgi:hypothetical protein